MSRFSAWMNRTLDLDTRYVCGCCDDRFAGRAAGISHVIACHPEYAGSFANEHERTPAGESLSCRPVGGTRPSMAVWG